MKNHKPKLEDSKIFEEAYEHIKAKFGSRGYAKFYFEDVEYENFLKDIRKLLANKDLFISIQKSYINGLKGSDFKLKF